MRAEVRCCCDAHLIGYVEVPGELVDGREYKFPLLPVDGRLETGTALPTLSFECDMYFEPHVLTRGGDENISWAVVDTIDQRLALKSRDYPIELVRRIPGFIEAPAGGN